MGTDIYITVQKRIGDEWVDIDHDRSPGRNYAVFGWLANVRNYAAVPPLSMPRGFPNDVSEEVLELHENSYTKTWYDLTELTSFDFDQAVENRRVTRNGDGGVTADPGEGQMTTYRELFEEHFFEYLDDLAAIGATRLLISFD